MAVCKRCSFGGERKWRGVLTLCRQGYEDKSPWALAGRSCILVSWQGKREFPHAAHIITTLGYSVFTHKFLALESPWGISTVFHTQQLKRKINLPNAGNIYKDTVQRFLFFKVCNLSQTVSIS
uniref:Uncharacterized protein n=1 Tax=Sphaerodactylus townsendi TaxID=933632 RepID=A0ACB8FRV8_9SAUR